jgi:predicted dehydrogenase
MIKVGMVGARRGTHGVAFLPVTNPVAGKPRYEIDLAVTQVWEDEDEENVTTVAARHGINRVDRPELMLGKIDMAWITDTHWERFPDLAAPFLKAGLPTFVNRPFAISLADGLKTIELAEKHRALLMSGSCMQFNTSFLKLRDDLVGQKPVRSFTSMGSRSWFYWYMPHTISQMHTVLGGGVEYVHAHGPRSFPVPDHDGPAPFVYAQYKQSARHPGAQGTVALGDGHWMVVCGPGFERMASAKIVADADTDWWLPLLQAMERMVKTGQEPETHEDICERLKVLVAVRQSFAEQREVALDDLKA